MTPKTSKKYPTLGPKLEPKIHQIGGPGRGEILDAWFQKALGPKKVQNGSRWPQGAQDSPKLAQKGSQDSSKMGQIGPRWVKIAQKLVQQGSKIAILLLLLLFPFPIPFLFLFLSNGGASQRLWFAMSEYLRR